MEEKKPLKDSLAEAKVNFKREIVNKNRWLTCLLELLIVGLLIAADLLTKKYIYGACLEKKKIDLISGVLSLVPVQNTGASFGMLSGKTLYLTVVSTICAAFLVFFIFYTYNRRNLWLRSALILITAGAIGNIIDRIALGYVRDFIYFELINFAVFNFADSCLTVGTIVLLVYILFFYSKEEQEAARKKAKQAVQPVVKQEGGIVTQEAIATAPEKETEDAQTEEPQDVKKDGEI